VCIAGAAALLIPCAVVAASFAYKDDAAVVGMATAMRDKVIPAAMVRSRLSVNAAEFA
jgi:hypothetical protein